MSNKQDTAIHVQNVSKQFKLPHQRANSVKSLFLNMFRKNTYEEQKVLQNVSFEVRRGEFLGIVGRNGGGKSTLLKLISGIYSPDSGSIRVTGRLTPFIELGVGFNPELTGRENVYLNGALLGFSTDEVDQMYDEIVEFAELERFMDQKLNNYSSGMQVRLAFSIAVRANNEILVLDEVLAVGDANFQQKCLQQFHQFKKQGKTIILVSHSMDMVEKFCDRVIVISEGKVDFEGSPSDAVSKYEELNITQHQGSSTSINNHSNQSEVSISEVTMISDLQKTSKIITPKEAFQMSIRLNARRNIEDVFMAVRVCEAENRLPLIAIDNFEDGKKIDINLGDNLINVNITEHDLIGGKFYFVIGLYDSRKRVISYAHYNGMQHDNYFMVKGKSNAGVLEVKRSWEKVK